MFAGKYEVTIYVNAVVPEFPAITITKENPAPDEGPLEVKKYPHTIEFFEEDGVMKAIHATPRGKQKVDKVTYSDYSAAWSAYAGSEGVELFHFVMILSESTNAVWGFTAGISPFFRGYTPFAGVKVQ